MIKEILVNMEEEEQQSLLKALDNLHQFLQEYK